MLSKRVIVFCCIACSSMGCASSAQMSGVKVVEENTNKKYTQIKTAVFKSDATILKDTTNQFNRYPSTHAINQYIPSLADVQEYEDVLKNTVVPNEARNNENFISRFKKYNRQYSGFINKLGDTVLVVCFLEFTHRKEANKFFYNWKYQNSFFGTVLYLHKKSPGIFCYSFNKRKKEIKAYKAETEAP